MSDLIYPNLYLFLYDLREGLGESPDDLDKNRKLFAGKLPESLRDTLLQLDIAVETEYRELLPNRREKFPDRDKPFEGYYYPVRLNDTYGLLLACSFAQNSTRHPAECVAKFKGIIEEKLNGYAATIGQTWLIFAQLANPNANPEEIAKKCCQELELGLNWEQDMQGQGRLLGGTLFELSRYRLVMRETGDLPSPAKPPRIQDIQQSHHVIIALYPDERAAKRAAKLNFSWMRLFGYRHKMLWAYGQSCYLKQQLKKQFADIQVYVRDSKTAPLKKRSKILADAQETLFNYTIALNNLGNQSRTVEINLLNYQKRLARMQQTAAEASIQSLLPDGAASWLRVPASGAKGAGGEPPSFLAQLAHWQRPSDLKFLECFSDYITNKYLLQLQKDSENLSPGLQVLGDLINSIRGMTEIEHAQRDRNFQTIVAMVGVGLGAGSAAASLSGNFPAFNPAKDKPEVLERYKLDFFLSKHLHVPDSWLVPATLGIYCLIVALTAGAITGIGIRLWWCASRWRK
ncbi:hypothetical protein [Kamptonema formosum]|uniref:hypothetical protein n=1 Tax=Kamptonema formosum TaxID=331992 RepID=UPI0003457AFA|nr:hypothetical protein [Oscillatoria sp. PCC 10802]